MIQDYEDFDEANEMDELEKFLKGAIISNDENTENNSQSNDVHQNGNSSSREVTFIYASTIVIQ
jgi:hypothetical protein